jgi:hypothetical protein
MGMSDAQDLPPAMRAPEGSSLARRARSLPACPFEWRSRVRTRTRQFRLLIRVSCAHVRRMVLRSATAYRG